MGAFANEKSSPFDAGFVASVDLGWIGFDGMESKKPPPAKSGGEVTCAADGVDLAATGLVRPLNAGYDEGFDGCRGCDAVLLGKLRVLNASVKPPNASC